MMEAESWSEIVRKDHEAVQTESEDEYKVVLLASLVTHSTNQYFSKQLQLPQRLLAYLSPFIRHSNDWVSVVYVQRRMRPIQSHFLLDATRCRYDFGV